jgi:large subunit ribosomal protein L22
MHWRFGILVFVMKASVKHIRISPKKAGLVAALVRRRKALEALSFLKFTHKKGADIIYKVVASAVANAENNDGQQKDDLFIKSIVVTKGRTLKRGIPASRGRVAPIKKRSSHIYVELSVMEEGPEKGEKEVSQKEVSIREKKVVKGDTKKSNTSSAQENPRKA